MVTPHPFCGAVAHSSDPSLFLFDAGAGSRLGAPQTSWKHVFREGGESSLQLGAESLAWIWIWRMTLTLDWIGFGFGRILMAWLSVGFSIEEYWILYSLDFGSNPLPAEGRLGGERDRKLRSGWRRTKEMASWSDPLTLTLTLV